MIVSISQPYYLPWLGYWDRIKRSDVHIVLDAVQLEKGGFTNRVQIRQRDGRPMWLSIPVEKGKAINRTCVMGTAWADKHVKAVRQAYGMDAPVYPRVHLANVLSETRKWMQGLLGVTTPMVRQSDLRVSGAKSELVLNLCREMGATEYLSGPHGRDYLDLPSFERAGIGVVFHDFPAEQPVLSALDYLYGEATWPQADLTSLHS